MSTRERPRAVTSRRGAASKPRAAAGSAGALDPGIAAIIAGAPVGAVVTRAADAVLVAANAAALGMLGLELEVVLGSTVDALGLAESRDPRTRAIAGVMSGPPGGRVERTFERDGEVPGRVVVTPLAVDAGGTPHVAWFVQDLTDEMERDRSLRASEDRYRSVVAALAEGVVLLTREGSIVAANESAARIFGRASSEEILGPLHSRPWRAVREDGSDFPVPEHPASITLMTGEPQSGVVMGVHDADQPVRWISVNSQPVFADGDPLPRAAVVSFADITGRKRDEAERRRLEAQLVQAQKMEAVGTLAGGIAHDFNNVLFALQGNVEMARLDVPADHPARPALDETLRACQRAKALVQRLLAFSRRHESHRRPMRVGPIVAETIKLLRASLPATVEISREASGEDAWVLGDEVEIQQVLMNLCTNAGHALGPRGGRIVVRHGAIEGVARDGSGAKRHLHLSVSDSGHGIDPSIVDRIFDPFFTTKPPGEGTGLGLAVVQRIVASHGGEIRVHATPGAGATFDVQLPIAPGPPLPQALPEPARATTGGQRVLFVDDEPALVRLASRLLARIGLRVTAVGGASDALALLREDPQAFDVVLSDVTMPQVGGLELAIEVRRLRPDLPVVLTTGYDAPLDADTVRQAGVREVIGKPWTAAQLLDVVERCAPARARG